MAKISGKLAGVVAWNAVQSQLVLLGCPSDLCVGDAGTLQVMACSDQRSRGWTQKSLVSANPGVVPEKRSYRMY